MCKISCSRILTALTAAVLLLGYTACAPAVTPPAQVKSTQPPAPAKTIAPTAAPQATIAPKTTSFAIQIDPAGLTPPDAVP